MSPEPIDVLRSKLRGASIHADRACIKACGSSHLQVRVIDVPGGELRLALECATCGRKRYLLFIESATHCPQRQGQPPTLPRCWGYKFGNLHRIPSHIEAAVHALLADVLAPSLRMTSWDRVLQDEDEGT